MERSISRPFAVYFKDPTRPDKAVKRLRAALKDAGFPLPSLGAAKSLLAHLCGHQKYSDLVISEGEADVSASLLDHELASYRLLMARRDYQICILRSQLDLPEALAGRIINECEPTGNGNFPLKVDESGPHEWALRYSLPLVQPIHSGHYLAIKDAEDAEDEGSIYRIAFHSLASEMEEVDVRFLSASQDPFGVVTVNLELEEVPCSYSYSRKAIAILDRDEPRRLRPSEVSKASLWVRPQALSIDPEFRYLALDLMVSAIASDALACAIWCIAAPRPSLIESFDILIEYGEDFDLEIVNSIRESIAFCYECEIEEQNVEIEGSVFDTHSKQSLQIQRIMKQIKVIGGL